MTTREELLRELERVPETELGKVLAFVRSLQVSELGADYRDWVGALVCDPEIKGGEPVFPNSRLSVARVGGLLERDPASERELREDYPYLSDRDFEFARIYVRLVRDGGAQSAEAAAR